MPVPSVDQFMHLMRPDTAVGPDPLLARLRAAYEALVPYAPASVRPVVPPWPMPALAFEAGGRGGRTLVAATRELNTGSLDSQLIPTHQGTVKSSVHTAQQRLADAVSTWLGPVPGA